MRNSGRRCISRANSTALNFRPASLRFFHSALMAAIAAALQAGIKIHVSHLFMDPSNRADTLPGLTLLLMRENNPTLLPLDEHEQ